MEKILNLIGDTPIVEIPSTITSCNAKIYVKLEEFNLGGSIKSRVGLAMIDDAEKSGVINTHIPKSNTIIEATGGNTGIGIAQICALKGYKCILVIPDNYSPVRIKILEQLGAQVILSDHTKGNDSHIQMTNKILEENPNYINMNQFTNPMSIDAHYRGTGQEIVQQIDSIDAFVSSIGSGGTITGCGRAIKERIPSCKVFAVQPAGCDVLKGTAVPHIIQGTALGIKPNILDCSLVDGQIDVEEVSILSMQRKIAQGCGLFLGYSSIANIVASIKASHNHPEMQTIVTVSPDGGKNYIAELTR